jgi:putative MFS transporter
MNAAIQIPRPVFFSIGVLLLSLGVLMHVPDFLSMEHMDYSMAGMPMSPIMLAGMAAIVIGLALSSHGLVPRWSLLRLAQPAPPSQYLIRAMDDAPVTGAHWWLLFVLGVALVIDVMKPATLGFILPGLRAEYGISAGQAAALPVIALTGTTIGSVIWGILADRLGRRAAILLAAMFFLGTSICGFMPSFAWNLFMCFVMGLSAGGMLPIVYALMAETVPARVRGWLVILHGGLATACGYLAASGLAAIFEPVYSWRILWFAGLPTGLLIVLLNRWIPESPRFLLERGDEDGARAAIRRFGIKVDRIETPTPVNAADPSARGPWRRMLEPRLGRHLTAVLLYGLGWGIVNWGFVTFLPTFLRNAGFTANTSALLFYSALASIPGSVLVAYLYGRWSSRKSMIAFALLTSLCLAAFAWIGDDLARLDPAFLISLTAMLMLSSTAVVSMLSPYAAEVFPTDLRATGGGLAAASSKVGGMVGPPLIGAAMGTAGGIFAPAILAAVPIGLAAVALIFLGEETRQRGLEQITQEPLV